MTCVNCPCADCIAARLAAAQHQPWSLPQPSCRCPLNTVCMNTACPRAAKVTCSS